MLFELKKKIQKPEISKEDYENMAELIRDIKNHKIEFRERDDEDAAQALTNMLFHENEKKRKLVMEQLSHALEMK